ncbi:MAG: hypothetical protein WBI07_05835 [Mobilitalea sp.]
MNYPMLKKLRDELTTKTNRTREEEAMLNELKSLGNILDRIGFSLATSSSNCPSCGQPLRR